MSSFLFIFWLNTSTFCYFLETHLNAYNDNCTFNLWRCLFLFVKKREFVDDMLAWLWLLFHDILQKFVQSIYIFRFIHFIVQKDKLDVQTLESIKLKTETWLHERNFKFKILERIQNDDSTNFFLNGNNPMIC